MRRVVILVLVASLANPALADTRRDEARQHFRKAEVLLDAGRFDEAVAEYSAAYGLVPSPAFLYNIAQAYRKKGDLPAALDYYRKYLDEDPKGKAAAAAREHVVDLEARLAAQPKPTPTPAPAPPPETAPPPAPPRAPEVKARAPAPPVEPVPRLPERKPREGGAGLRTAGIVSGGVGVAGIAAGIYFGLKARSLSDKVSETFEPSDYDSGRAANRNMFIGYGVGAVGLVAGGILYYLGSRSQAEVVPVVVVGRDSVQLTWGF